MTTRLMPTEIVAGDTLSIAITSSEYPSSNWTLCLAIRGPMPIDLTATPDGDGYLFSALHTTTRTYPPGLYKYVLYVSSISEQYTLETGNIDIVARADLIRTTDVRSHTRKVLDAVEATIEGRATSDQLSYTINGRSLERTPLSELLELRKYYKELEMKENATTSGVMTKNKVKSVMNVTG